MKGHINININNEKKKENFVNVSYCHLDGGKRQVWEKHCRLQGTNLLNGTFARWFA